ncbi:helix-turn-helix domain-containing protein [Priestia megaterium]|uniref:helix-turn-helix domain-containing protein n=1 Tax=Priestia megaterium TaxID=1404 RepID=UPI0022B88CEF|nr:helix-turn-helix transcriptional regulator [Priestia megaterium]MCZ8497513.1 helix-turn-helix transcriptional regulator [Priestia megaterium]
MSKIKELRLKNGDTLKDLAKKINYDFSYLSKIERGVSTPSISLLKKVAITYDVNITYLIENDEHIYTSEEKDFINDLCIDVENIHARYNLTLDGKDITEEEFDFMIDVLRKLRYTLNKKQT